MSINESIAIVVLTFIPLPSRGANLQGNSNKKRAPADTEKLFLNFELEPAKISYECRFFFVFIAGDAELLGRGFATGASGLQQQRSLFPFPVLQPDFNPDLRFCLLCTVVRLRQGIGFFAYSIVAASPIERLPSQRKAGHTDIRRKDLHILNPHVANRDTQGPVCIRPSQCGGRNRLVFP